MSTTSTQTRVGRAASRPTPGRRRFWTSRRRDHLAGYLFISPQLLGTAVFVVVPLVLVVWYSLHEWNVLADTFQYKTSKDKVFSCGDMRRGQSLVVWAIREGRQAARSIDLDLMGKTALPR